MLKRLRNAEMMTREMVQKLGKTHAWVVYHLKMLDIEELVTRVTKQS